MAAVILAAAFIAPEWRARASDERVEAVVTRIDELRADAESTLGTTGRWPPSTATPNGEARDPDTGETIEWRRIASAVMPPPPSGVDATLPEMDEEFGPEPPVITPDYFERGAISVHSDSEAVLARLVERYQGSFVHDTVWTLLLPRVPAPPTP